MNRARRLEAVGLAAATAAGAWLRLQQIASQITADDEWHALYAAYFRRVPWILTHFGASDHSIPLALADKLLARTIGLTELGMRAPMLAAGILALVALPRLVRPHVGAAASVVFAWLLATSPLLVYFSRYARPYALTLLLATVAWLALWRWTEGERRAGIAYVACAACAAWLHLAALPAVLAPLATAAVDVWRGGLTQPRRSLAGLATGVVCAIGLLVGPPLVVDGAGLGERLGGGAIDRGALATAARLLTGSATTIGAVAALTLSGCGVVVLARRRPRFAGWTAGIAAFQIAAIVVVRPARADVGVVLARYALPVLPILLAWLAIAVTALGERLGHGRPGVVVGSAALLVSWSFASGPLPGQLRSPNAWTNHALFQYDYGPAGATWYDAWVRPRRIPPFYARLAGEPRGSLLLVEAPWYYEWSFNPYPYLQAVHRQRMMVGLVAARDGFERAGELPASAGFAFRNAVHVGDEAGLARRGVRFVVFHKDLRRELRDRPSEAVDVSRWIAAYRLRYGTPAYEDETIAAFDLSRRAAAGGDRTNPERPASVQATGCARAPDAMVGEACGSVPNSEWPFSASACCRRPG